MSDNLKKTILKISEEYKDDISHGARNYVEVNIGDKADSLGFSELKDIFSTTNAIIPIKQPVRGMKVRIDGRGFANYGEFDSGIAVPGYLAKKTGMPYKTFIPNDSMILNFS